MRLQRIAFLGPNKPEAALDFVAGVNVICGASETGKSFVVEAIDFMMGGGTPLRDLPERVGYNRVQATWLLGMNNERTVTIERADAAGNYSLVPQDISKEVRQTLREKASGDRRDTLSAFLLEPLGLFPKKVKRNSKNETNTFSIRDLSRLTIVPETLIDKQLSPYLSGQVVSATAEYSALKLMLTGSDDSALKAAAEERVTVSQRKEAKLELFDDMISKLSAELEVQGETEEEARARMDRLDASLAEARSKLDAGHSEISEIEQHRRIAFREASKRRGRMLEIDELTARFVLLDQHYQTDIRRLDAIRETGSYFVHLDASPCPLCGAAAAHQAAGEPCDGDTEAVVRAAAREIEKIAQLRKELGFTQASLDTEKEELGSELASFQLELSTLNAALSGELSSTMRELQDAYETLLDTHVALRGLLWRFERLRDLQEQRDQLAALDEEEAKVEKAATKIPQSALDELSQRVLTILKAWEFPDADRIHFDEAQRDFVIDGKPRGSRGKGLRAITHAAATIGLLEHCRAKNLPHSGLLVMDSPLLAYYEPEGDEDDLKGTDLKVRFYEYLIGNLGDAQIIVVENEPPPQHLQDKMSITTFTRNPHQPRFGFFPVA